MDSDLAVSLELRQIYRDLLEAVSVMREEVLPAARRYAQNTQLARQNGSMLYRLGTAAAQAEEVWALSPDIITQNTCENVGTEPPRAHVVQIDNPTRPSTTQDSLGGTDGRLN